MKRVYIFTIGFTAEFVLKPLLEVGVGEDVYVIVLYTLTGDEYSRKRVTDAIGYVERLSREAGFADRVFFKQVPLENTFYDLVYRVAEAVFESLIEAGIARGGVGEVHVWLTGGMRTLILATLVACKLLFEYMGASVVFHVWSEDGSYRYAFGLPLLDISLKDIPRSHVELLKKAVSLGECTYSDLADVKRKESTVRKMVEHLKEDNLMECSRSGKHVICRATDLGSLVAKMIGLVEVI